MPYAGQRPFGDIYSVPTPERAVNAIAEKIYREKLMQDQQRRMEEKALDDDFGKNIARVKSVDVPEISQAYNEFKQAHIGLQKKGSQATPEDQMAVLLAKAKVDEKINGSVEDKEYLKLRANEGKSDKKGRYNPDFNLKIQGMLNTPTSKRNRDLDDDALLFKYSFPDLTKVIGDAVGKGEEVKIPTGGKSIKGDLYNDENVYKKINDPNKVYNTLYTGIGSRPDHINFSRVVLDSITDQEAEELKTRYFAKINDPRFKAIYGEVKPFPESAGNTDLGKAVAIKTMQAVDVLPLDPIRTDSKLNTDAVMDKRFKQAKIMEGIKQANRKELFGMREDAKAAGEEANDLWIDNYLNKTRQEAKASGKVTTYKFGDGRTVTGYPVPLDPVLSKAVGFDDKNKGMLMVTDEGKYVPIFYETDANYAPIEKNGTYVVDKTKTNILSQDAIKLALGGKTGVKQLNKEMTKPSQKTKPKKDPLGLF